jgi:hypothetical protein
VKPPAHAVIGHLVWSRNGRVWAIWRVAPTPYLWLPTRRKYSEHARVRSALASLPAGQAMILSPAARIDPAEVIEAMVDRVDLPNHPGWASMVEAGLDRLEAVELYERRYYLAVQLPERSGWRAGWRAISTPVTSGFGLGPTPIPVREIRTATRQADDLESHLRALRITRASPGEIRWLYARALRRGLDSEPPRAGWPEPRLRATRHDGTDTALVSPSLQSLVDGTFYEGGARDDADRPWHRRYLRVDSSGGVSYQAFAVVADAPQQFAFPGGVSEWLYVADQLPIPVDWTCRITVTPNQDAARAATRQQRELAGQVREYAAEPGGAPPSLAAAMDAVDDERAQLAAAPADPELQVTMIYAVASNSLADLEQRVGLLQATYRSAEWDMPTPTGGQRELFEAMLPGAETTRVCRDYRQYMLPSGLAAGMPFAGAAVGDAYGMLLGASRDAGCARPILIDPAAGPAQDRDGSIAVFGTLGTGKSYLIKRLAATTLLRGGQMVFIDRTHAGEYVRFADAMTDAGLTTQVATVTADHGPLLDPLTTFGDIDMAVQTAVGYLSMLCGVPPTSLEAACLSRSARAIAERGGRITEIVDQLKADHTGSGDQDVQRLALRIEALAGNRFAAPVFRPDGDPTDTTADCVVLHLPDLAIPGRETMLNEHLSRQLLPEQVSSLGLLYVIAAIARAVAYQRRDRFGALCLDEAWALTATLPGQQLLGDAIRDGRKHNAAVWIASQHPDDLPKAQRDLVSTRFLFGLTGDAASIGLEWLGVDPTEEHMEILDGWTSRPEHGPGERSECLLRDASGRIGRIEIADAETDELRQGFESNPTRLTCVLQPGQEPDLPAVEGGDQMVDRRA